MKNQRGIALLVVMMFLVLMAATAVSVNHSWYTMFTRTKVQMSRIQAKWQLLGAETYAIKLLEDSLKNETRVSPVQKWAQPDLSFATEDSQIKIHFYDAQSCFNINTLKNNQSLAESKGEDTQPENKEKTVTPQNIHWEVFNALLVNLDFDAEHIKRLNESIKTRLSQEMTEFSDISELRPLPGMNRERYMRLLPFLCVLPDRKSTININSLGVKQEVLLRALFLNKPSVGAVRRLLDSRAKEGWESIHDPELVKNLTMLNLELPPQSEQLISTTSHFFKGNMSTMSEQGYYTLQGLFSYKEKTIHLLHHYINSGGGER